MLESGDDLCKQIPEFSAAILAGGASRRMGADKALLRLLPGGPTILERLVALARSVSNDVFVVAPARSAYVEIGVRLVSERCPGIGPISGLEAALAEARHERCLVLACDLPLLTREVVSWLAAAACEGDALVPVTSEPGGSGQWRSQPLVAIYHRRCLPRVSASIDAGVRALGGLLDHLDVCYIEPDELARIDPELQSFNNLNTPGDLDRLRAWMVESGLRVSSDWRS